MITLTECPRDAMQGIATPIATEEKIQFMQALLRVGFPILDFGSFVSPKAVPQMADTAQVLQAVLPQKGNTALLAIVANLRGAQEALQQDGVDILGYPFSISETFQKRNTGADIETSLARVEAICNAASRQHRQVRIYLSMAFGNPYGEPWHPDLAASWAERLYQLFDLRHLALSDTVGSSTGATIKSLFTTVQQALPQVTFWAHLHTAPGAEREKIEAAYEAGCRHFDGALKGYGGCPMADDHLTGNMPTELLHQFAQEKGEATHLASDALKEALALAPRIMG